MMKIIDFEKKGNVVRFYLGNDDCNDYWGDDWSDSPYEHNAETVYSEYITSIYDVAFPFEALVLEPCNGELNSPYSKEDMQNRQVPCIIVVPPELANDSWQTDFKYWVGSDNVIRFYFNDDASVLAPYQKVDEGLPL